LILFFLNPQQYKEIFETQEGINKEILDKVLALGQEKERQIKKNAARSKQNT
jgi:hypothetical protein